METVSAFFKALPDTFGTLELDDVFVVVFVALIVLALLLGYVLGRRVTSEEEKAKKKKAKMDKKLEKEKAQETKTKKNYSSLIELQILVTAKCTLQLVLWQSALESVWLHLM